MREILFRGKRTDNGEWVEGYLVKVPIKQDLYNTYRIYYQPFEGASSNTYHQVIPETVGQFTGLTDKNGKKIFEGDIVKCHYFYEAIGENFGVYQAEREVIGEIAFQGMGLWIQSNTEEDSGYLLWITGLHEDSFEVIGKIHDNPELLKGGQQ